MTMDGQLSLLSPTSSSSTTPHRKRLTKKQRPPSTNHRTSSSFNVESLRIDAQSLDSKRSSSSLRRAPKTNTSRSPSLARTVSVPVVPSSNAPANARGSNHSLPRSQTTRSQSAHRPYNPTPTIPTNGFIPSPASLLQPQSQSQPYPSAAASNTVTSSRNKDTSKQYDPLDSCIGSFDQNKSSTDELIGAPFDGKAILNRIEATKLSAAPATTPTNTIAQFNNLSPRRIAPPPPTLALSRSNTDSKAVRSSKPSKSPKSTTSNKTMGASSFRQSASFSSAEQLPPSEKTSKSESSSSSNKRHSGDGKESRVPGMLRKKSGFSGFMNSLVGSPKKPLISAPENPVHVTHVGYDSNTGQFTVRHYSDPTSLVVTDELTRLIGLAKRMATFDKREWNH